MSVIFITIILFIAFTIGLNLGLHGVMLFTHSHNLEDIKTFVNNEGNKQVNVGENSKPITAESKTIDSAVIPKANPEPSNTISSTDSDSPVVSLLNQKIQKIHEELQKEVTVTQPSSQSDFSNVPVIMLTCCRPKLLSETLASLMKVRGVDTSKVLIIQDGNMGEIQDIGKALNIKTIQNLAGLRLRGGVPMDGGERIARHYRFALTSAFDSFPDAPAIVIVEDDLLFSPDFYEYLTNTGAILLEDPTTFVVSAWNDNGFTNKVRDPYRLRRTDFFPGLGWLLTRDLYKNELEKFWPNEHWDHWLRSPEVHRGRETIHPEVPRTYHNGVKGTFMDLNTHNKYFKDIAYNQKEEITWKGKSDLRQQATNDYNEHRILKMINSCHHLTQVQELVTLKGKKYLSFLLYFALFGLIYLRCVDEIICIWINIPTNIDQNPPFTKIASFFGIWHEHKRGNHKGLHEFYFQDNYILLMNLFDQGQFYRAPRDQKIVNKYKYYTYREFKPQSAKLIERNEFELELLASASLLAREKDNIFKADATDRSCDEVSCISYNLVGFVLPMIVMASFFL
jgi:hypothetical protein